MLVRKVKRGSVFSKRRYECEEHLTFFSERGALVEDIVQRHAKFGYDPLDRALAKEGISLKAEQGSIRSTKDHADALKT